MYGMLSNWSMNSVQAPIMDKGFSVLLASADSKPRMILGVSCYASPSGGNTTNVVPVLAMVPSQELAANSVVDTNTVPVVYIARSSQPITTTLATTYSPASPTSTAAEPTKEPSAAPMKGFPIPKPRMPPMTPPTPAPTRF